MNVTRKYNLADVKVCDEREIHPDNEKHKPTVPSCSMIRKSSFILGTDSQIRGSQIRKNSLEVALGSRALNLILRINDYFSVKLNKNSSVIASLEKMSVRICS